MRDLHAATLAILLCSATFAVAASSPTTILPDNVVLCQAGAGCYSKTLLGRDYKVLSTPRFTVMVSLSSEGAYTRADVSIANHTGMALSITPDDFRVEVVKPKTKIFTYIPPAALVDVLPSPTVPKLPSASGAPAAEATPTGVMPVAEPLGVGPPRLINAASVQTPPSRSLMEPVAGQAKEENPQDAYDKALAEQHLAAASLGPNEVVSGRVYFDRDKHTRTLNVVIPIAGLVFEFPYQMGH